MGALTKAVVVVLVSSQLIACSGVDFSTKTDTSVDGQGVVTNPNNPGDPKGLYKTPELTIEEGSTYTNRDQVRVDLISEFAIEMYYTNDPTCTTGGLWESYESQSSWSLAQLNATARVYAKVKFPNGAESVCVSDDIVHDNVPPKMIFSKQPAALQNNPNVEFEFEITDQGSGVELATCQLNSGEVSNCGTSFTPPYQQDGFKRFRLFAMDKAGNMSEQVREFTIDTVAPVVNLTSGPFDPSRSTRAKFEFTVDDTEAATECLMNELEPQACVSGAEFVANQGQNQFRVKATDLAGNIGYSRLHNWYVDSVGPGVTITAGPENPTNQSTAKFEFVVNDPNAITYCRLNNGSPQPCQTGGVFLAVQGQNQFQVIATDSLGNTGTSRVYSWYVDSLPPSVTITSGPDDPTSQPEAQFEFVVDDPTAEVKCSLNGSAYLLCKTGEGFQAKEGQNNFQVQATDALGNVGRSQVYSWYVDSIGPAITITAGPEDPSKTSDSVFEFVSNDQQTTYTCVLNNAEGVSCVSGDKFEAAEGQNSFYVVGSDQLGNKGRSDNYDWYVDTIGPNVTITSGPDDPSASKESQFAFQVDDSEADTSCKLNDGEFEPCQSGSQYLAEEGENSFQVKAVDPYGHEGLSEVYTWNVDTIAPSVTITSGPDDPSNELESVFDFVVDDDTAAVACRLNDGAPQACKTGDTFIATEGSNEFQVIATDQIGNAGSSQVFTWYVDSQAPSVTITSGPESLTNQPQAVFEFSSPSDPQATFECLLNDRAAAACDSGDLFEGAIEGENQFRVVAIDPFGNRSEPSSPYTWSLDTKAPQITFLSGPSSPTSEVLASFTYSVSGDSDLDLESLSCTHDQTSLVCPTLGEFSSQLASDGSNSVEVRISDRAGNEGTATYSWTYQPEDPNPGPDPICVADNFEQPKDTDQKKLDVMFVVDTSGSMDAEKDAIANGINRFIEQLPSDTDYRMAVLPAHGKGSSYYGQLNHVFSQNGNKNYVLTSEMSISFIKSKLKNVLKNSPSQLSTDGGEVGLASLQEMLTNPQKLALAKSQGILRDDAALAVIFVADENDICAVAPQGVRFVNDPDGYERPAFLANCVNPQVTPETVYQALKQEKGNEPLLVTGVIYNNPSFVPSGGENELGYGILELVEINSSFSVDMAYPDLIDDGLAEVGAFAREKLELLNEFLLTQQPVKPESVEVKVDNIIVPAEFIDPNVVSILTEDAGQAESKIEINYCLKNVSTQVADAN
ncbi:MAG: VWA domain-containing protein [Bdellovibrionales bacterium]|nr:VWA domain-containing protein [Bdellovibrionales bacterium]